MFAPGAASGRSCSLSCLLSRPSNGFGSTFSHRGGHPALLLGLDFLPKRPVRGDLCAMVMPGTPFGTFPAIVVNLGGCCCRVAASHEARPCGGLPPPVPVRRPVFAWLTRCARKRGSVRSPSQHRKSVCDLVVRVKWSVGVVYKKLHIYTIPRAAVKRHADLDQVHDALIKYSVLFVILAQRSTMRRLV